jgi:dihydrolipoamide dehydrogenase
MLVVFLQKHCLLLLTILVKLHFADHGIELSGEVKVNLEKMIARKQAVVDQTSGGVKFLMDKNKITVLEGLGSF